jgi:hypothetical protein
VTLATRPCCFSLFQVLPPALASRAHTWHNELNVKEGWICWDNIYFEAPGAPGEHSHRQQVGCGSMVVCGWHKQANKAVLAAISCKDVVLRWTRKY